MEAPALDGLLLPNSSAGAHLYSSSKLRPLALWLLISWMASSSTFHVFSAAHTRTDPDHMVEVCLKCPSVNTHREHGLPCDVSCCTRILLTSPERIDLQRVLERLDLELQQHAGA
jgi:hypothetical protein